MTSLRNLSALLAVAFVGLLQVAAFYSYFYTDQHINTLQEFVLGALGVALLPMVILADVQIWKKTIDPINSQLSGKHIFWALSPAIFFMLVLFAFFSSF